MKKLVARQRPADTQFADGEAIRSVDGAPRLLVHSLLGRGSFSEVYRVRWDAVGRRQGRMFALKVVKAARLAREHAHDLDAELEESVVAARVRPHAHVVAVVSVLVHDFCTEREQYLIVTDLVDTGVDLAQLVASPSFRAVAPPPSRGALGGAALSAAPRSAAPRLGGAARRARDDAAGAAAHDRAPYRAAVANPSPALLRLLHGAALGLAHVHDCGVIHQDIKAANVLLSSTGVARIADFGLACVASLATDHGLGPGVGVGAPAAPRRDGRAAPRAPDAPPASAPPASAPPAGAPPAAPSAALVDSGAAVLRGPLRGWTPTHASPEQTAGARAMRHAAGRPHVTHRSDVFNFGAFALELAGRGARWASPRHLRSTLAPPAQHDELAAAWAARSADAGLGGGGGGGGGAPPPGLRALLRACLGESAAERPASMRAVADDLARLAAARGAPEAAGAAHVAEPSPMSTRELARLHW